MISRWRCARTARAVFARSAGVSAPLTLGQSRRDGGGGQRRPAGACGAVYPGRLCRGIGGSGSGSDTGALDGTRQLGKTVRGGRVTELCRRL